MKTTLRSTLLASLLLGSSILSHASGVPQGISYQATITDESGNVIAPAPGAAIPYNITLSVYDAATNGNELWAEVFNGVPVSSGRFSVILGQGVAAPGSNNPLDLADIFDEENRFVEIKVQPTAGGTEKKFAPRQQLLASPTAMRAKVAEVAQTLSPALRGELNAKAPVTNPSFQGTVAIDSSSSNTGTLFPGLRFGDFSSLEGISSKRTPGVGQYGLSFYTGNRERMTLTGTGLDVAGRLDAGTAGIAGKLDAGSADIAGNLDLGGRVAASGEILSNSSIAVDSGNTNAGTFSPGIRFGNAASKVGISSRRTAGFGQNGLTFWTNGFQRMNIANSGNVSIGAIDSGIASLTVGGVPRAPVTIIGHYMNSSGQNVSGGVNKYQPSAVAIYTEAAIWSNGDGFIASSDERIKVIQGRSDPAADLSMLNDIEVTDYRYKDTFENGDGSQKKVIAQQVEKVFPLAVSKRTGLVPDIYKLATYNDGWVHLESDLKKGERVKLITGDDKGSIHEVLEVTKGKFRTSFKPAGDKVFVYGREVNDFRTVDYDAIAMLNVSATQELHRRLEAKTKEIEEMKKEMAALKGLVSNLQTKDETREARLIAIEKLLAPSSVKTVSK